MTHTDINWGMYERFAPDLSENLFNSVYRDLFALADAEQKRILQQAVSIKKYQKTSIGECQENLNNFCNGKLSLGDALDFICLSKWL